MCENLYVCGGGIFYNLQSLGQSWLWLKAMTVINMAVTFAAAVCSFAAPVSCVWPRLATFAQASTATLTRRSLSHRWRSLVNYVLQAASHQPANGPPDRSPSQQTHTRNWGTQTHLSSLKRKSLKTYYVFKHLNLLKGI